MPRLQLVEVIENEKHEIRVNLPGSTKSTNMEGNDDDDGYQCNHDDGSDDYFKT